MFRLITDGAAHIYLACGSTDFRKQITGLVSLVQSKYQLNPYSPVSVFLFCNKRHDCIKALHFEEDGFVLATKKLMNEMKFDWPRKPDDLKDITPRQVRWLLEGLKIEQKKAHEKIVFTEDICY